jgi:pimeloyl-ACP methyl ester carboxylesterase
MIPVFEKMGFKIILRDFKGQMKSGKSAGIYFFAQHAAEALFRYLSVEHVYVIGTSYGGESTMKLAIRYPEITDSISIIDSRAGPCPALQVFKPIQDLLLGVWSCIRSIPCRTICLTFQGEVVDSVSELDEVQTGFVLSWNILCGTGDGEAFYRAEKIVWYLCTGCIHDPRIEPDYLSGADHLRRGRYSEKIEIFQNNHRFYYRVRIHHDSGLRPCSYL